MNVGDRVRLVQPLGIFEIGCEGVIDSIADDGSINVSLDKNKNGSAITPPAVMPPAPHNYYQVI